MEIIPYRLLYRNGYYKRNKSSRIGSRLDRFQNAVTRELHVSHDASMFAYLTNLLRTKNTSAPSHRSFIFYFFFFLPPPLFSDTCLPRTSRSADGLTHRATIPRCALPTPFRNLTRMRVSISTEAIKCATCHESAIIFHDQALFAEQVILNMLHQDLSHDQFPSESIILPPRKLYSSCHS